MAHERPPGGMAHREPEKRSPRRTATSSDMKLLKWEILYINGKFYYEWKKIDYVVK